MTILNYQDKEYLLKHIEFLESRYENLITKDNQNWMDNWDECIGKVDENGDIFISKETTHSETFCISKEELIEARKEFQTPADWVYEDMEGVGVWNARMEGETFKIV
jgi:hypothetical protein